MLFRISEELNDLADLFRKKGKKLFIVGGYVRNKLLNIPDNQNLDIDLCSSATPDEVVKILKNTKYIIKNADNSFGVVKIESENKIFEHATFRTEKYAVAGSHNPSNVEFIQDVEIDALRRDFRCNSVYYDIYNDEIVDPLGGVKDIKNRILRTTRRPSDVFNDDSERIMRMVRQAVSLGFTIDNETFNAAKNNVFKLAFLQKTRLKHEFERILQSNEEYKYLKVKNPQIRGIVMLAQLKILGYILPCLQKMYDSSVNNKKGKNLFDFSMNSLSLCNDSNLALKYAILMQFYGETIIKTEKLSKFGIQELENIEIENELGDKGLEYNKKFIANVKNICNNSSEKMFFNPSWKIRMFIIKNFMQINEIILIKKYNSIANFGKIDLTTRKLINTKNRLKYGEYPITYDMLSISVNDIIELYPEIKQNKISDIQQKLLQKCIKNLKNNKKDKLIKIVSNIINKNRDLYLEEE